MTTAIAPELAIRISRPPIRIGMIGMGAIARKHLDRLTAHDAVIRIVGTCDPSADSLTRCRQRHPRLLNAANVYSDYTVMLAHEHPDAVIICSPHRDHYQQLKDCLAAGAHILTEKPLVNTAEQADEIIRLAQTAGLIVGIAYQRHTWPHCRYIREGIRRGVWGKVLSVCGYQQEGWKSLNAGTWRQQPEISGGGCLHDGGAHLVELVLWLTNLTPASVSAWQDNRGTRADVDTVMNLRFAGGVLGTLAVMGDVPGWYQQVVIGCQRGTICFSDRGGYGDKTAVRIQHPDGAWEGVELVDLPPTTDVAANFVNAIVHGEPIAAPLESERPVIHLTEAAVASARLAGQPVDVTAGRGADNILVDGAKIVC